jgi:hypothetical protein
MIAALGLVKTGIANSDIGSIVIFFLVMGGAIFILLMKGKFDRERIQENIEASGGKVIDIERRRLGGVGGRYMRTFDVTYTTRHGRRVEASCITNMTRGVIWVSNHPPGGAPGSLAEKEPIECLECGAKIPAGKMRCQHCGWSYKGTAN